ncbi:MAG: histidine phosphatase family protein [Pseudomonadota bacterium]
MRTKTLYLLRHGEAETAAAFIDFDRPLSARGRRDAMRMGAHLAQKIPRPEFVLCSAARRAVETWRQFHIGLEAEVPVRFRKSLYLAGPNRILKRLARLPARMDCVLVVGHNPGFRRLACRLVGRGDGAALSRLKEDFPPAGLAAIRFQAESWERVADGEGELACFAWP